MERLAVRSVDQDPLEVVLAITGLLGSAGRSHEWLAASSRQPTAADTRLDISDSALDSVCASRRSGSVSIGISSPDNCKTSGV